MFGLSKLMISRKGNNKKGPTGKRSAQWIYQYAEVLTLDIWFLESVTFYTIFPFQQEGK